MSVLPSIYQHGMVGIPLTGLAPP